MPYKSPINRFSPICMPYKSSINRFLPICKAYKSSVNGFLPVCMTYKWAVSPTWSIFSAPKALCRQHETFSLLRKGQVFNIEYFPHGKIIFRTISTAITLYVLTKGNTKPKLQSRKKPANWQFERFHIRFQLTPKRDTAHFEMKIAALQRYNNTI